MANNSNGYVRSVVQLEGTECYLCGYQGDTARHEVFYGEGRREKSKRQGLWVHLCPRCHQYGPGAVHRNRAADLRLKRMAQQAAMAAYGWDVTDFIREYGMNYI